MDKRTEINNALKDALKSKDVVATATVRLILAALKDRDISARSKGNSEGVDETEILSMLSSMIKQRQESAKVYSEAGRDDLAEREEQEVDIIQSFMPAQLTDEELSNAISDLIAELGASDIKDMGKVMAELKSRYAGQVDMSKAGAEVRQKLS